MGQTSFRNKVRYYEDNVDRLQGLSYEERIDVELDYSLCLFEIGKYHKYLQKVDPLIETVITDNIFMYNGEDIYKSLLFKKAACLFNTGQYQRSQDILKAVIKLDPENDSARSLYGRCKRKEGKDWYETTKAVAMMFLIGAASITFAEIILVKPFYAQFVGFFFWLKITCIVCGLLALVGNRIYLRYQIGREIGYGFRWNDRKTWF